MSDLICALVPRAIGAVAGFFYTGPTGAAALGAAGFLASLVGRNRRLALKTPYSR